MPDSELLFGAYLVQLGLISQEQVLHALALQRGSRKRIGEVLIDLGYVSREQIRSAIARAIATQQTGQSVLALGEILIQLRYITRANLEEVLLQHSDGGPRLGELLVSLGLCTYQQIYEALDLQRQVVSADTEETGLHRKLVRVLVVDGLSRSDSALAQGLQECGYQVGSTPSPSRALDRIRRFQPDIVLCDTGTPKLDVVRLCSSMRLAPRGGPPLILVASDKEESLRIAALKAGADDVFRKGDSFEELVARIDAVLRRTGESSRMRALFGRYTSDDVVDEILRGKSPVLKGEKREVTILFVDIRNFTSLAELLPPEEVVSILNRVLGTLADVVFSCGGTLDKFLGDGLMAIFGAPISHSDHALRAVQAAQMMMAAVTELEESEHQRFVDRRRTIPFPDVPPRIGINTGTAVVGTIGSSQHVEYTCIGDVVNVASRLCARADSWEILAGERTRTLVDESARFVALLPARLKGKSEPEPLYRVLWRRPTRAK